MISFHWCSDNIKEPPYIGHCPIHGDWENWIHDNCVVEDWEIEKRRKKPKQDKMLMWYAMTKQPTQLQLV